MIVLARKYRLFGMAIIWIILLFVITSNNSFGQSNPYIVTFETGITHPATKSYASTDTVWCDSIPWTIPGTYLGTMTSNDFAIGNHAARMRLSNNTSGNPAYMEMLSDLPLGVQNIQFYTAMYGSDIGGELLVLSSIDGGQSWQNVGDTIEVTATHDTAMKVSLTVAISAPIRFKIQKINSQDSRIDVDSIVMTQFGSGHFVLLSQKYPVGQQISIYMDSLKMAFDHSVLPFQGQITLHRLEGGAQNILIPSSQVFVQDSSVWISGIDLQDNSHYYITMSDSAFVDTVLNLYSLPITDTSFWTFITEDTIIAPQIPPLTGLDETFLACNESQNLMGMFKAFSRKGNQYWDCEREGHLDSFAVSISGGFAEGLSAENEDWLISELPFNLSGTDRPILSFWEKGIYEGAVDRALKISFDYTGNGFPFADSVHWMNLNIPGISAEPPHDWHLVDGVGLSQFKDSTFYLAFTYACQTNGAYKLYYDDIRIQQENTGIVLGHKDDFKAEIIGFASQNQLTLQINSRRFQAMRIYVYDLEGRLLCQKHIEAKEGLFLYYLTIPELSSGIYLMRLSGQGGSAFLRFFQP